MLEQRHQNKKPELSGRFTRRDFLVNMTLGGVGIICLAQAGCGKKRSGQGTVEPGVNSMIVVDYTRCTGCRTCEAVCSAYNHQETIDGEKMPGLGNPHYANIQVRSFNPDVDVPSVCAMCSDAPCVEACPVEEDEQTGHKAMFRNDRGTISNNEERCIGCGSCVLACQEKSVGIIALNPVTNTPERLCTLCDGDPQCVKYCPYGALSVVSVDTKGDFYRMSPEDIATTFINQWYTISG